MKNWLVPLFLALLIFSTACSQRTLPVADQYLVDKGYEIVAYKGHVRSYELTKENIITMPYLSIWGVQSVDPAAYFGKTIEVERYIVKDHPLSSQGKKGYVDVYVMLVDGQPIGGTSLPFSDELLLGGSYSLEGKTLEELQPKPYPEWHDDWVKKYGG